ncbi:hypothetical protein [Crystallibacter degradans]|uniref:hypothetical protein n=1 Tax=Crystallibacter degradans TaxID=2726743 RepID=UPI001F0EABC0|nr:hypothetical protein [Arthrobacter sp. SF27]
MTEGLGKFMDDFAALVQLAQARQQRFPRGEQLLNTLSEHLGLPANEVPVVVEEISAHRFADVDSCSPTWQRRIRSSGWSASAAGTSATTLP